jgi:hypothetical protein
MVIFSFSTSVLSINTCHRSIWASACITAEKTQKLQQQGEKALLHSRELQQQPQINVRQYALSMVSPVVQKRESFGYAAAAAWETSRTTAIRL